MPHASSDVPPTATPPSPMEEQMAPTDQIVPLVLQVVPVFVSSTFNEVLFVFQLQTVINLSHVVSYCHSQDIRQILTASPEGRPILQRLDEDGVITIKQRR